jgi:hypothetical protein
VLLALKAENLTAISEPIFYKVSDRFCGLVGRVPGYRSRGPGSIPGSTRFSEK